MSTVEQVEQRSLIALRSSVSVSEKSTCAPALATAPVAMTATGCSARPHRRSNVCFKPSKNAISRPAYGTMPICTCAPWCAARVRRRTLQKTCSGDKALYVKVGLRQRTSCRTSAVARYCRRRVPGRREQHVALGWGWGPPWRRSTSAVRRAHQGGLDAAIEGPRALLAV